MKSLTAGMLLASAVVGMAAAQTGSVETGPLTELCASSDAAAVAYCRGFLVGAGQYHEASTARGGLTPIFCLGEATPTVEQAQIAFVAWARANPQHAGERAIDGVMRWAAAAFPCPAPAVPQPASRRTAR
ncbi:Rap1a/Tai family immunity protein [Falsiroseomonas sp.]|uniref:Rap1a/Tai family immunity protein n=1 Tax=Falsiroseomonas sp. TaxID=2870721 RepID=UPI00271FAB59|nr:Rap1a/Tai family immunity protein [Falsiroseomonas sp.]MDO9503063.1 Rap1a/Tai family immunity protein [Falsiroseomonas sp.]